MSVLIASSKRMNALQWMASPGTPDGADALYPISNLYNGRPWERFRHGALSNVLVDFDLNQVPNGGSESAYTASGLPALGWGKTPGATLTRDTSVHNVGVASMKIHPTSLGDGAYYDVLATPGRPWTFGAQCRSTAGGTLAALFIRNMITGHYLNAVGTGWTSIPTPLTASTSTAWSAFLATVTVEDVSWCGELDVVPIRMQLLCASTPANDIYFDEVVAWPGINCGGLLGHNVPAVSCPIEICSGSVSPASTVRGTLGYAQRTMFASFAVNNERYWRLRATNPPLMQPLWYGELVLTYAQDFARSPNFGHMPKVLEPQDRFDNGLGETEAYSRVTLSQRDVEVTFDNRASDHVLMQRLLMQSRNGLYPLLVVLDSTDPTSAMLCRVEDTWAHTYQFLTLRPTKLRLRELPFPLVTP